MLNPKYTKQISTVEVVRLSVDGTGQLEIYFGQYLPQLFYAVAASPSLFLIVTVLSLICAVVFLVFVPLIPLVTVVIQKLNQTHPV